MDRGVLDKRCKRTLVEAVGIMRSFFKNESPRSFPDGLSPTDHKANDRFIGQALQRVSLRNPERWEHVGQLPFDQSCTSRLGM